MEKWEHYVVWLTWDSVNCLWSDGTNTSAQFGAVLDVYGQQGWELVNVAPLTSLRGVDGWAAFFKPHKP